MSDAAPGLGRCMGAVLRMSKMLETAHDNGEAKDLDDTRLKKMWAAEASKESSSGGCGESCKLEMYKDAMYQRVELWDTIRQIAGPAGDRDTLTAVSRSMDFFKTGKITAHSSVHPTALCCSVTISLPLHPRRIVPHIPNVPSPSCVRSLARSYDCSCTPPRASLTPRASPSLVLVSHFAPTLTPLIHPSAPLIRRATPSSFAPLAGLKGWLADHSVERNDTRAALKSACECEPVFSNGYCHYNGVKTAGWPKVLYDQDAKLQAVLVGIEQDQRKSKKNPEELIGGNNNFIFKWKQKKRGKFVKKAVREGVTRRAEGVATKLTNFISSKQGDVLKSALLLAKAVAITGAVGVYATCDILHTGHDFAKAMSNLAKASGGVLCKSLQEKLDTPSAAPTQESSRFKGISRAGAGADTTRTKRFKRFKGIFRAGAAADTRTRIETPDQSL